MLFAACMFERACVQLEARLVFIEAIELASALLGTALLWRNLVQWRFRNFATSVFLLCYVPLFCVYPLIGRLLSNGAISIDTRNAETLADPSIYYVYQTYNLLILIGFLIVTFASKPRAVLRGVAHSARFSPPFPTAWLLACLGLGIYLYVYSTGLSVTELLTASRFEWFLNDNYSSLLSVVASYFVALAPALVYLCVRDDRRILLFITLLVLVAYGVLSKDRKWLIFIASGLLAARYVKANLQIALNGRDLTWLTLLGVALAFWQVARGTLFTFLVEGNTDLGTEVPLMLNQLLTRGDLPYYYNASVTAIHMNLNEGFSIPLGLLRRQLLFFLPTGFSFGLKVEDISAIFSDAVEGGDDIRRGNMPPGLIGLLVISFEWWGGLIIAIGLPFLLRVTDRLIRRQAGIVQIALISNLLSAALLLLRGDDSSATYFIVFTIIVLSILKALHHLSLQAQKFLLRKQNS